MAYDNYNLVAATVAARMVAAAVMRMRWRVILMMPAAMAMAGI